MPIWNEMYWIRMICYKANGFFKLFITLNLKDYSFRYDDKTETIISLKFVNHNGRSASVDKR